MFNLKEKIKIDSKGLVKKRPEKSLIRIKKKTAGRSHGKITVRHRGGGVKRFIRLIDFKRKKYDIPARVEAIEYDPNRSAYIALIKYKDGEKSYILAPEGLKIGDSLISSKNKIEFKIGNRMPLKFIPPGFFVYNLELTPGRGGVIGRSAGVKIQLLTIEGKEALLKLPSGEIRKVPSDCQASIGSLSNPEHRYRILKKAGRARHMGWRPEVRGKAMNPPDHPHGGGEGHPPIGLVHPKTPWGKPALGVKTRKKRWSDKLIIKRRSKKKRKR